MAVPTNKEELQKAIVENFYNLNMELSTIPYEMTTSYELETRNCL